MAKKGLSVKTMKRMLKKAGLKTTGRKAALTRRAKKSHLMRGGGSRFFIIQVTLLIGDEGEAPANMIGANNSQDIIDWYNNMAPAGNAKYFISNPVISYLQGNEFRVEYDPIPGKKKVKGMFAYADPDPKGTQPLSINGTEYLVTADVKEGSDKGVNDMEMEGGRRH